MKNDKIRQRLYLAALLHNIGRVYMRANPVLSLDACKYKIIEEGKEIFQYIPYSIQFILEMKDILNGFDMGNIEEEDSVYGFILKSYKNDSIIKIADNWTVGKNIKRKDFPIISDKLKSVFSVVSSNSDVYFNVESLDISNLHISDSNIVSNTDYNKLWNDFVSDFKLLPRLNFKAFTESLLFLLKKYTWSIPVDTLSYFETVSIYEFTKVSSAIVDCLYVYYNKVSDIKIEESLPPTLLLGGDVNGIQNFIYNIASTKASISLKGRSFYVQLLVDSIIQKIITHEEIDCSFANVIYSSGGKFYMILPNIGYVNDAIENIIAEVETELWEKQKGQLSVNITKVPFVFTQEDLEDKYNAMDKTRELWQQLNDNFAKLKNKKFRNYVSSNYELLFSDKGINVDTNKICAVTGFESNSCEDLNDIIPFQKDSEKKDPCWVLPIVKQQALLGRDLKNAKTICSYRVDSLNESNMKDKCYVGIQNEYDLNVNPNKIKTGSQIYVKAINNTNFLNVQDNYCYGFQFYGGNEQSQVERNNKMYDKTFEELSSFTTKDGELESTYLGILRLDVDNLGDTFINFKEPSFAKYSVLSFCFDFFFSGYLNTIRNQSKYKNDVNILYSGGDDVFAVGRWDKLVNFANEIRENFREFVGCDEISISGGISIVGKKYPIAKASELAGKAEKKAKEYETDGISKNAFCLFDQVISWKNKMDDFEKQTNKEIIDWLKTKANNSREYAFVKANKEMLVRLLSNKDSKFSNAILHKIMAWYDIVRHNIGEDKKNYSYIWHSAYYLSRYYNKLDDNDRDAKCYLELLKNNLLTRDCSLKNYRLLAIASRWAELTLRFNFN